MPVVFAARGTPRHHVRCLNLYVSIPDSLKEEMPHSCRNTHAPPLGVIFYGKFPDYAFVRLSNQMRSSVNAEPGMESRTP